MSGASIGDQCCRSFFYGEDETVENGLAAIEGHFATALGNLSLGQLEGTSAEDKAIIGLFVHLQRSRTVAAANEVAAVSDGLVRRVLEKDPRMKKEGIDSTDLRFHVEAPQMMALQHAVSSLPLVADLDVKFLVTDKKPKFVVSDDPVVLYNQYAEQHPRFRRWPAITGMAHKGLQIFMPVSPEVCVALFDPSTYEYGPRNSNVCTPSVRDIGRLNDLQAINARECIYFNPRETPDNELERLRLFNARSSDRREPAFIVSKERDEGSGQFSQMIAVQNRSPRLGHSFGFVRVTDDNPYENWNLATIPIRSPEAVAEVARRENGPDANTGLG